MHLLKMKRKLTTQLKEILNSNFFVKGSSTKISLFQKKKKKKKKCRFSFVKISSNNIYIFKKKKKKKKKCSFSFRKFASTKAPRRTIIKCESKIMESKLLNSLKSMKNDKSLGSMAS